MNGAVDVAFGGEVHHGTRLVLRQNRIDLRPVTDVGTLKNVSGISARLANVFGLAA